MPSRRNPKIERLATIELFRGCTRRQLHLVAKLATEVDVDSGATLCRQGDQARECFVVLEGLATMTVAGDVVATIGPGGLVGELALLDGDRHEATVTAMSGMHVLNLSAREFEGLLAVPVVSRRLLASCAARLREASRVPFSQPSR